MDPKKIVTAALFMSPNPLSTRQLMNLVNTTEYNKGLKIIKKAQKTVQRSERRARDH